MKKTAIILSILALIVCSCRQATKQTENNEIVIERNYEEEQAQPKIKYVFKSDDGDKILFFDDGYAWKWESKTLNFAYKEFPTYLLAGKEKWELYDNSRQIASGWEIFNYQKMKH